MAAKRFHISPHPRAGREFPGVRKPYAGEPMAAKPRNDEELLAIGRAQIYFAVDHDVGEPEAKAFEPSER